MSTTTPAAEPPRPKPSRTLALAAVLTFIAGLLIITVLIAITQLGAQAAIVLGVLLAAAVAIDIFGTLTRPAPGGAAADTEQDGGRP